VKVYAQYFEFNGLKYRLNTILQFGNSFTHIGNIILANPGSSKPAGNIDEISKESIKTFFDSFEGRKFNDLNWYEFSVDTTMRVVEKIFNGSYITDKPLQLNGVVQLFNAFNIANPNLDETLANIPKDGNPYITTPDIANFTGDKPTYIGLSHKILHHRDDYIKKISQDIFKSLPSKVKEFYQDDIEKTFYHPMYLSRAYHKENIQNSLKRFFKALNRIQEN
jgi:hypothetical protein